MKLTKHDSKAASEAFADSNVRPFTMHTQAPPALMAC